MMERFEP